MVNKHYNLAFLLPINIGFYNYYILNKESLFISNTTKVIEGKRVCIPDIFRVTKPFIRPDKRFK